MLSFVPEVDIHKTKITPAPFGSENHASFNALRNRLRTVKLFAQPAAASVSDLLFYRQQREMVFVPTARFHVVEIIANPHRPTFACLRLLALKSFTTAREVPYCFLTYPFR